MNSVAPVTQDDTLHAGFLRHAALRPNAPAVRFDQRSLSYGELETKARQWAAAILSELGRVPERIGVFAYRDEVSYTGVLAALFAGAAFVPLNRTFPPARTRTMIAAADLDALIVDAASAAQLPAVLEGLPRRPRLFLPEAKAVALPNDWGAVCGQVELDRMAPAKSLPTPPRDGMAYLLFTSGSTGQPMGVPIAHANVTHFLAVNQQRYQFTPTDRLTQTFDQTFDLSVFDLFMAWGSGACVCSCQPIQLLAPARFLTEHEVTVWFSVPSVAALLRKKNLLKPGSLPGLRWSLFCGEALPEAIAETWQAAAPGSIVENLYGPTELTIACAVYRWDPQRSPAECAGGVVPIGQVYPSLRHQVVDEALQPVADGESGELCVAGPQTFSGYWRDPAKTATRTFQSSDVGGQSLTFYRTGDRVRRLPSGDYVFLGRLDHQIKVMGWRVELGEVNAALRQQPGVTEAATIGWPPGGSAESLVSFVSGTNLERAVLAEALRARLPAILVPQRIEVLDALPLNVNGKVDLKELAALLDKIGP